MKLKFLTCTIAFLCTTNLWRKKNERRQRKYQRKRAGYRAEAAGTFKTIPPTGD